MSETRNDDKPNSAADAAPAPDIADLPGSDSPPTDDTPTIISRSGPHHVKIDEPPGGLRGRRLAHFELIEPIGVGGMAAVIRARDTQLDRLVALKILPPDMANDPEIVRRFHQEARSAARLDHENIARVFFCGEDQKLQFIAFEFVEGDNLRTILERRGRLPVAEAIHYVLQVAAGLARSLERQDDRGLTQSGVTLGTFDYISPEQALEPRDADVRSDIYSLGCTFYHVLTGQPPVPEGTAAKKLHHHQHVKPPDPRQFVPDLPDEAAVILDRMMAKQPKDRYQTPEHLVHHLYLAARKLGAAAEVPEGVLAVEAALPRPPAGRPLVLVAIAAIAVVALIFLIDFASVPKTEQLRVEGEGWRVEGGGKRDASSPPLSTLHPPPSTRSGLDNPSGLPIENEEQKEIPTFETPNPTAAALAEFLQKNKTAPEIILKLDDLNLGDPDDKTPDLVVANSTVTIRPLKPGQRPTIRDQYRARLRPFQASLTIQSKRCTIENIRFVLNQTGASAPMAILWLNNCLEVNIRRCEFIQAQPCSDRDKEKDSRMASLLADATEPARLTVTESCFLGFGAMGIKPGAGPIELVFSGPASGGQDAVTRRGPVRIETTNCLFGPHAATFRLELAASGDNGLLSLNHCSVLAAGPSAVFDLADGADARIVANFSLFSNLSDSSMMGMSEGAVLLRRVSSQGEVLYQGHENRYHQFDKFLAAAEDAVPSLPDDMNIKNSEILETSPWKDAQPLDSLRKLEIQTAFAVNPHLPELRVPKDERKNGRLIGSENVLAFSYLDNLPPLREGSAAPSQPDLVVQSLQPGNEKKRLYTNLEHALIDAHPGDTIRLQIDGEIKLDPRMLNGEKLADLTIRADPGFHPILTMSGEEAGTVPALFGICNGKLHLEGLAIRLRPRDDDWCAVVSFYGDGVCVLKNCLVTLERSNHKAALAVLPHERMKKTASAAKTPRLLLENCFIRGHGDLLWMQDGHAAEVTIDNSLIALSGSLLNVVSDNQPDTSARGKDEPPAATAPLALRLHKVTTYLGGNLIRLHAAKDIKGLPKTRCEPVDCLFLPARDRALVRLDGPEAEEKALRDKFSWESNGRNAYGNFTALLEQQAVDSLMNWPTMSNQEKWQREVSGETSSKYNVKLPDLPAADAAFAELLPASFRPDEGLQDFGADPAALRSLPALKGKADAAEPDADFPDSDN